MNAAPAPRDGSDPRTAGTDAGATLLRHPEHLAVARLGPGADLPSWAGGATLLSVTATRDETSVVCAAGAVPRKVRQEGPFVAFEVEGPLDFALTGILARLLAPLAEGGISVFALSTFDTDWVLVPVPRADDAAAAWKGAGCRVLDHPGPQEGGSR